MSTKVQNLLINHNINLPQINTIHINYLDLIRFFDITTFNKIGFASDPFPASQPAW